MVHRRARRRGLARALLAAVEQRAWDLGYTLLTLDTVRGGAAEQLYRSHGWTAVGTIPNYALDPHGSPCDTVVFFKAAWPTDAQLEDLAGRFQSCTLHESEWTHAAHLAVGTWHVSKFGESGGIGAASSRHSASERLARGRERRHERLSRNHYAGVRRRLATLPRWPQAQRRDRRRGCWRVRWRPRAPAVLFQRTADVIDRAPGGWSPISADFRGIIERSSVAVPVPAHELCHPVGL